MLAVPLPITRGPEIGICNLCGTHGKLTEDHTPPKGCVRPTAMDIRLLRDRLSAAGSLAPVPTKPRISQNGVKFRTLCTRCNSGLLGTRYDPVLIRFANDVAGFLGRSVALPINTSVPTQPALLMRAVFGHMAAHCIDRYRKGPRTDAWRDFFSRRNSLSRYRPTRASTTGSIRTSASPLSTAQSPRTCSEQVSASGG